MANGPIKFKIHFKIVPTYLTSRETTVKFMNVLVRFPEIVVIGQSFSSAPVRVVALMVFIAKSILRYGVKYYLKTCSSTGKDPVV